MTQENGLLTETDKPAKAPWFLLFVGAILRKIGSARTTDGAGKDDLLAKNAKGIVSFVQNFLPSRTQKEGVRPVPKAFRLREVFQTAGIGTLYGLLFAPLLPHLEAQSSGSSNTPQARDEIAAIKIGGVWKKIPEWIKNLFGGAAGSAIGDNVKAKWNAKPSLRRQELSSPMRKSS